MQDERPDPGARELMTPPEPPKRPIGFVTPEDKGKKTSGARSKA
jgi:hypothetical protein